MSERCFKRGRRKANLSSWVRQAWYSMIPRWRRWTWKMGIYGPARRWQLANREKLVRLKKNFAWAVARGRLNDRAYSGKRARRLLRRVAAARSVEEVEKALPEAKDEREGAAQGVATAQGPVH